MRLLIEAVTQIGKPGIQRRKEFFIREAAPFITVERFVSSSADPALNCFWVGDSGEYGGDVIAKFHPTGGGFKDFGCCIEATP